VLFNLLAHCAAGTLVLPLALVSGLLTFPTTCACGAAQPHSHPLYAVAGHDHQVAGGHHGPDDSDLPPIVEVETAGAILGAAGAGAHAEMQAAWTVLSSLVAGRGTRPVVSHDRRRPDGADPSLDPPPPQAQLRTIA
jgi:hypothetical protein